MPYGTVNADVIGTSVANSNLGAGNATRFKNRIINGDMRISQRYGTSSVTPASSTYPIDRFQNTQATASTLSYQQVTTAPSDFANSQLITVLASRTPGAGDRYDYLQVIEGNNMADLAWGTASAKTITVSFWVYSSVTGTFACSISNGTTALSYVSTYTISNANTWTKASVTIPGPTSGTWYSSSSPNGNGLILFFDLGCGSNYSTTANSWQSGFYETASGCTKLVNTNGATFYITGVQLEVGSSATGFDYRDITTELVMCQRYFEKSVNQETSITANSQVSFFPTVPSTTVAQAVTYVTQRFVVTKRTAPTMTIYPYTTATNTTRVSNDSGTDLAANSGNVNGTTDMFFSVNNNSGGTITTGAQLIFIANWYASAEL